MSSNKVTRDRILPYGMFFASLAYITALVVLS